MRVYLYEADLEADCTNEVIQLGGEHRKLDTGVGSKGQLDHAYWLPNRHFIVEFKLPGEHPKPKQQKRIDRLRKLGVEVHVIDTYEYFMKILNNG